MDIPVSDKSRIERELSKLLGIDINLCQPQSRIEGLLLYILENGTEREQAITEDLASLTTVVREIAESISEEYDPELTYAQGVLVRHDGKLYRSKIAITVPEPWTPEHWDHVDLEDEITAIKQDLALHKADNTIHVTSAEKEDWNAKYDKPSAGIPKTDLSSGVQTSLEKADSALQEHQSLAAYRTSSDQDVIDNAIKDDVSNIESLIPSQASQNNPLADKDFVNSSIGTNTAHYISDNGLPFTSVAALEAYTGTVTNNDYAFVTGTDESGNAYYDRYKATVSGSAISWAKEYRLNNSSFTAAQWASISSGITALLVSNLESHLQNTDIHVTAQDKTNWNNKYSKPATGIPKTDLNSGVQESLGKANTALQSVPSTYRTAEAQDVIDANKLDKPAATVPADYVPTSDGEGGYSWQEQSGGILPTVIVNAISGSTVTLQNGSKVLTAEEVSGTWSFRPTEFGIWTATAVKDGVTATNTVDVQAIKTYRIPVYTGAVYGIKRTVANSSPEWERTDNAADFTFSPTIGDTEGYSDFDAVSPWKDIVRENVGNDVMVKIPNFYVKRYVEEGVEYIKISMSEQAGFVSAVKYGETVPQYFYVGAYKTGSGHVSKSGVSPLANITRASFRSGARNKGAGWGMIDARVANAVNLLMLVEIASYNSQAKIGRGHVDSHSTSIATGSCDNIKTGRPAGADGNTDIVYRYIEGWWGNVWEFTDGLNWNGGQYLLGTDRDQYADDTANGYDELGYSGVTNWSSSYLKQMGYDADNPEQMLPVSANGSDSSFICDAAWSSTGWRVFKRGGNWPNGSLAGAFAFVCSNGSSGADAGDGSRLLYIAP